VSSGIPAIGRPRQSMAGFSKSTNFSPIAKVLDVPSVTFRHADVAVGVKQPLVLVVACRRLVVARSCALSHSRWPHNFHSSSVSDAKDRTGS